MHRKSIKHKKDRRELHSELEARLSPMRFYLKQKGKGYDREISKKSVVAGAPEGPFVYFDGL